MFGKIIITGQIEVITGMHIGTGGDFSAIGAVDAPVIRDAISALPIIPGSSLKGKLRSVLARKHNKYPAKNANDDCYEIRRLFGSPKDACRLAFSDMYMTNKADLDEIDVSPTEVKFENTINRLTGVANPRQIERTIRGCCFGLELTYSFTYYTEKEINDVSGCKDEEEKQKKKEKMRKKNKEIAEDMELLADGMRLLMFDYLGGHGSRGYGKIAFKDISAKSIVGEIDQVDKELFKNIDKILKEVG